MKKKILTALGAVLVALTVLIPCLSFGAETTSSYGGRHHPRPPPDQPYAIGVVGGADSSSYWPDGQRVEAFFGTYYSGYYGLGETLAWYVKPHVTVISGGKAFSQSKDLKRQVASVIAEAKTQGLKLKYLVVANSQDCLSAQSFGWMCTYRLIANTRDAVKIAERSGVKKVILETYPSSQKINLQYQWYNSLYTYGQERAEFFPEPIAESQYNALANFYSRAFRGYCNVLLYDFFATVPTWDGYTIDGRLLENTAMYDLSARLSAYISKLENPRDPWWWY